MRKYFNACILAVLSLLIFSCSGDQDSDVAKSPNDVIDYQKMVRILVDYHLAEGSLKYYSRFGASPKILSSKIYTHILEKHSITRKEFRQSIKYYTKDTKRMKILYSDVLDRLSSLQSEIRARRNRSRK